MVVWAVEIVLVLVLVLVLGAQQFRIEDEHEHEGGSPLSWTAASTSPGRLGGRHREQGQPRVGRIIYGKAGEGFICR